MGIEKISAAKVFAGPGMFAWIAEAVVIKDDEEEVNVTVQYYDGEEYTVQDGSMYEFLAEDGDDPECEFEEEYDSWNAAQKSGYAEVFRSLRKVIDMLR